MITIGQRRTVTSWWVFYKQDSVSPGAVTPEMIEEWIEEAESDLQHCDSVLAGQYDDYVRQF